MRRRTLLAATGALLSAGCSQFVDESPTEEGTPSPTPTRTAEATPTVLPTLTEETPTTTAPGTPENTDTASPTATEEQPPSTPVRRAANRLEEARGHLADALAAYVGFADADGATLLDVTAAIAVSPSPVVNPVDEARRSLDEIPSLAADEQKATARDLRAVGTFLAEGGRCQQDLHEAFRIATFVVDRLYAERTGGVPDDLARLGDRIDDGDDHRATIADSVAAEAFAAFDGIDAATFTDKLAQFADEIAAFRTLVTALRDFREGIDAFETAASAYDSESYRTAEDEFPEAADHLRAANDTLGEIDAPASLASTVSDLLSVSDALALASEDLAAAADAGGRGDVGTQEDEFEAAEAHLQSSEIAMDRIDSVENLLD